MAVTKRITIKSTIKNAIDYIIDTEKTTGQSIADNEKALTYIADDLKTSQGELVYGHLCHPETAAEEFDLIKRQNLANVGKEYEDDGAVLGHHFIISFREEDPITPEGALEFGKEMMEKEFKYHQGVIAVHTNTDNLHIHMVVNAHTTDPVLQYGKLTRMKYGSDRASYERFRDISDKMCIEKGLSVEIPEFEGRNTTWYEHSDQKSGSTLFKNIIKDKILEAATGAKDWNDYKQRLASLGVKVSERGKTISYKVDHSQMKRPIREGRLGGKFTKEAIVNFIDNPEKEKETPYYTNPKYPGFRVKALTLSGRPKSNVQLIMNLAQAVLEDNESNRSEYREKMALQKELQGLYDNDKTRKEFGILDERDLKDRLHFLGAKINNYRNELGLIQKSVEKDERFIYLADRLEKKDDLELDEEQILEIERELKADFDIENPEDMEEHKTDIEKLNETIKLFEDSLLEVNLEYGRLARLREGLNKSRDIEKVISDIEHSGDKERDTRLK